jgi:ABC-2 type transport system permease protein
VIDLPGLTGVAHTLVPAVTVLVGLAVVLGGIAVVLLSRASSSAVA